MTARFCAGSMPKIKTIFAKYVVFTAMYEKMRIAVMCLMEV